VDKKVQVEILHQHSEHVRKVAATTSAKLAKLGQAIGEQPGSAAAETASLLSEIAALQRTLSTEADLFCKRLNLFLEETKTGNPSS
jgi:hypothetical protein